MKVSFRKIRESDLEFLWKLHNATLREYVEKTWGWDEKWQRQEFEKVFDTERGKIIVVEGEDAGFWWVHESETEVLLASIRLMPEFQSCGIGTRLVSKLLQSTNKPVRLQVLKVNPARKLYERLGFEIFDETHTHFQMLAKRKTWN